MPVAYYTISHIETRRVLAFASLERKTTLTDTEAWEGFRTELVGDDKLVLPKFGTHAAIEVPVEQLGVDEVDVDDTTALQLHANPYAFEIVTSATAPEPGDGTKKTLTTPGNTITPTLAAPIGAGAPWTLTVTLANNLGPTPVCVVFEGEGPKPFTIPVPQLTKTINLATTLTAGNKYHVLVIANGAPVFLGLVRAP